MAFSEPLTRRLAVASLVSALTGACGGTVALDFPGLTSANGDGGDTLADGATCSAGLSLCERACINTQSSNRNCGACGHTCPAGQVCTASACTCAPGQEACEGVCVALGKCSVPTCDGGTCTCSGMLTACAGECVDTRTNAVNCGACGLPCAPGLTCRAGRCQP